MLINPFDDTDAVAIALRFTLRYPAGPLPSGVFLARSMAPRSKIAFPESSGSSLTATFRFVKLPYSALI